MWIQCTNNDQAQLLQLYGLPFSGADGKRRNIFLETEACAQSRKNKLSLVLGYLTTPNSIKS